MKLRQSMRLLEFHLSKQQYNTSHTTTVMTTFRLTINDKAKDEIISSILFFCKENNFSIEIECTKQYVIKTRLQTFLIPVDEIVYLHKDRKNVLFILSSGKTVRERASLENVLKRIDDNSFVRIERGYAINTFHVREIGRKCVSMDNGEVLGIGSTMRKKVFSMLNEFADSSCVV